MSGLGLHESLARDRHRYERLLFMRMGGAISREDAEDIVSESLVRVSTRVESEPPQLGKEDAWFGRIVLNQGVDFLRARDGRKREGGSHRPKVVSLTEVGEDSDDLALNDSEEEMDVERLAADAEREQTQAIVGRVMANLDPKDAELVKLRHLVADSASRQQLASMAGLTVGEFRWRYARAWSRFVDAVALDAPTPRCNRVRQFLGELEAGTAPSEVAAEIDAHTLDCASCRVFARESYRALELLPFAPAVGFAERWSMRIGWWWERSGPEATAGAGTATTGAGLWALLGGGGTAGVLKAVAIVCSATVVTAGVCAGVVVVLDDLREPERAPAARAEPRATPTPALRPRPIRTSVPPATAPRSPRRPPAPTTTADTSGQSQIPASAPAGSSEFEPTASSAAVDPAPAPAAGGGEFAP